MTPALERAAAVFLTRTMLGFVYLFAGVQRLVAGASASGSATSALEIAVGALLLLGWWSRPVLRGLAVPDCGDHRRVRRGRVDGADGRDRHGRHLFLPAEDDLLSADATISGRAAALLRPRHPDLR
jgi:hypothetical protein